MKKYIPNPIRESLKFKPEVEVNKSSTAGNKDWTWGVRQTRFEAAGDQVKIEDKAPGVVQYASGRGQLIEGNHPRSGSVISDAEAQSRLS